MQSLQLMTPALSDYISLHTSKLDNPRTVGRLYLSVARGPHHWSGVSPNSLVTVIDVQWHGSGSLELTYKTPEGKVANEQLYRHDEALHALSSFIILLLT